MLKKTNIKSVKDTKGGEVMNPIPLTKTGEMLLVPEELGLTDESELVVGGFIGRHDWKGCPEGSVEFHETATGWMVLCTGCGLRLDVPQTVRTYGELRAYIKKEFAKE